MLSVGVPNQIAGSDAVPGRALPAKAGRRVGGLDTPMGAWRIRDLQSMSILVVLTLSISGCSRYLYKPEPVATIEVSGSTSDVIDRVERLAAACWSREATFWKDGVVVERRPDLGIEAIGVARRAPNMRWQMPFLVVSVEKARKGTRVTILEESDEPRSYLGFAADVERWLGGDEACGARRPGDRD